MRQFQTHSGGPERAGEPIKIISAEIDLLGCVDFLDSPLILLTTAPDRNQSLVSNHSNKQS